MSSRRIAPLHYEDLRKLGIVLRRAQYFITCNTKYYGKVDMQEDKIKRLLIPQDAYYDETAPYEQLSLFNFQTPPPDKMITSPTSALLLPKTVGIKQHILLSDTPTALTGEL